MGIQRNGARTFLNVLKHACDLSRLPGFRSGLGTILAEINAAELYDAWLVVCGLIDYLVATDNWYNQKDRVDDDATGEDALPF